jgi:hypothetical protein
MEVSQDILEKVYNYRKNIQNQAEKITAAKNKKIEQQKKILLEKKEKNRRNRELEDVREKNIKRREIERNLDEKKRWEILRGIQG